MALLPRTRLRFLGRGGLLLVGLAVAVPALILVLLGIGLTLRVAREVRSESARYNAYVADNVTEAFEHELLDQVRDAISPAEEVARAGGTADDIRRALASRAQRFEAPHFVPVDDLTGYSLVTVDLQLLVYGGDPTGAREHPFAAVLLRGPTGEIVGAGGWWFNPRSFIAEHLSNVVQSQLVSNPRLYGGISGTRNLAVQVFDANGNEVARMREPGHTVTSRTAPLSGPFETFRVRVTPTRDAPVVITDRIMLVELAFIVLLAAALLAATVVGLRHVRRQIQLVQTQASFMANVTHELKTPIAVIRLAVETLEMGRFRTEEERDKYLRTITKEATRLSQLVDNVLDFSRMESGARTLRFAAVDLRDVVESSMESFRLRLEDEGFRWQVQLPDDLPPARADATAIQHCLLNLLDNAVKYSRQRKELRVGAGLRDGMVTLWVADRGIGIDSANQKRIFEKFIRVETGLVHDVKGAGLGLSLVDQIIRAHHGRVEVESQPGEGSMFTLLLPPWDAASGSPPAEARSAQGS